MTKTTTVLKTSFLVSLLAFFISCNPIENKTLSNSMLVIVSLTGSDIEGNTANYLQSDVLTSDSSVTADPATVTLKAQLLNPNPANGASQFNSIMVTRYAVSYFRVDGKNTEGVDIPYSFEGHMSALIEIDEVVEVSFIIVREVAKLEPPLIDLHEGRGDGVLQVRAKVDFYGHDLANKTVKATGYLTIFFANYAD
ncbi:MAG: hypothetical protein PVF22_05245 [Candidatus Aminicenantes bacterium]|jgi:hypothetical protein